MFRLVCVIIGYFIGCIQSAYFVGILMKKDIRNYGSGNLGSTNALRVLGKKAGAVTFICDILKSVAAYIICRLIFKESPEIAGFYACFGVILGHDFPFYLKFKGGKGIASMIGMMFCIGGIPMLISFACGILGVLTKYVSVGSILFVISIPIIFLAMNFNSEFVALSAVMSLVAVQRHKSNIIRLFNGEENKLGQKKDISCKEVEK